MIFRRWTQAGVVLAFSAASCAVAEPPPAQADAPAQSNPFATTTEPGTPPPPIAIPPVPTLITSQRDADRLLGNSGITLQWISWDYRGNVDIDIEDGAWRLSGIQFGEDHDTYVAVEGTIREIGENYFVLDGEVIIKGTPDAGRDCQADKVWTFAITQNRQYYRLREFEWCDYLTDYVDIYF